MEPTAPEDQKTQRSHCDPPNVPTRLAWVGLVLAIIAFAVGAGCIIGGQWPPGLILTLAGVAGTMTWHRSSSHGR